MMNPTKPTRVIPAVQTFIVNHTSALSGFFASLSSLEQDLRKEPNPKATHFANLLHKRRNDLYIRIFLEYRYM